MWFSSYCSEIDEAKKTCKTSGNSKTHFKINVFIVVQWFSRKAKAAKIRICENPKVQLTRILWNKTRHLHQDNYSNLLLFYFTLNFFISCLYSSRNCLLLATDENELSDEFLVTGSCLPPLKLDWWCKKTPRSSSKEVNYTENFIILFYIMMKRKDS